MQTRSFGARRIAKKRTKKCDVCTLPGSDVLAAPQEPKKARVGKEQGRVRTRKKGGEEPRSWPTLENPELREDEIEPA